jgi:hypothetical protein
MMLKWKYFLSKRRMTPSSFIEARKITSYDSLAAHLTALGVETPAFDEVAHFFKKTEPAKIDLKPDLPPEITLSSAVNLSEDTKTSDDLNFVAVLPKASNAIAGPKVVDNFRRNKKTKSRPQTAESAAPNTAESADD